MVVLWNFLERGHHSRSQERLRLKGRGQGNIKRSYEKLIPSLVDDSGSCDSPVEATEDMVE